ncbi:NAD(P)-dependent oxidoreductase [Rhodococcus opacus]|uniref:NAD(P)-dependent oxidoreductase n=1 Tax=Rhodococcus opacus TaxID=37919 RepID=UPI001C484F4F|nr:NAD(P)-dependent oxidoreductase [Rhodococcus opacus]MBV6756658.1 NAD(P)-dependent oxidoreductase [Rhodococcus opacus]
MGDNTIGFIGLGHQGAPMARNVAKAGLELTVFDIREEALAPFRESGIVVAESVSDLVTQNDIIAICVLDEKQVNDLVLGEGGLLGIMRSDQTLVLHSTVSPELAIRIGDSSAALGIGFVDAPVSGNSMDARESGTLVVFAGGEEKDFYRVEPLLRAVGETVQLLGPVGSGQVAKLCNNLMLYCNTVAVFEAIKLASAYGIVEDDLIRMVAEGSGNSWSVSEWGFVDRIMRDHQLANDESAVVGFLTKDVVLANEAAVDRSVDLPIGRLVQAVLDSVLRDRWRATRNGAA